MLFRSTNRLGNVNLTDNIGNYALPALIPDTYTLDATARVFYDYYNGYHYAYLRGKVDVTAQANQTETPTIYLQPTATIWGVVYESDGQTSVTNAYVRITGVANNSYTRFTRTNARGIYTIPDVPLDQVSMQAIDPANSMVVNRNDIFPNTPGQMLQVDFQLTGKGTLLVKTYDFDGVTPLADAYMEIQMPGQTSWIYKGRTNSSGELSIPDIILGETKLRMRDPSDIYNSNRYVHTSAIVTQVGETVEVPIVRRGIGTITGAVVRYQGEPVENSYVYVQGTDFSSKYTYTDSAGVFTLDRKSVV